MMTNRLLQLIRNFVRQEDGPSTVEYAILLALLVGMMIASIIYVGDEAKAWSDIVVDGMEEVRNP
jgi:Flp pilus assembly pilin Flp